MEKTYKTKQKSAILEYLKQNDNQHITAEQIIDYFKQIGNPIGKSTVYRALDNLVQENIIRKYALANRSESACFQYVNQNECCQEHYHMKCTVCGMLIHIDCDEIKELTDHIFKDHKFKLDACKTILYGVCENCMKNSENEFRKE